MAPARRLGRRQHVLASRSFLLELEAFALEGALRLARSLHDEAVREGAKVVIDSVLSKLAAAVEVGGHVRQA